MDQWTEAALRARDGDRAALHTFLHLAYDPIRRLCAALVDIDAADDLAQETFIGVAKGIKRFRGESSGRTWVFAIAHHVCASELRSRARRRHHISAVTDVERARVEATPDRTEEVVLHDLLHHLEPERRAAFVLTQIYGMSYEETASICGCASGTVGSRVARARDHLIRIFDADDPALDWGHFESATDTGP